MLSNLKVQSNRAALKQLKQGIDVHAVRTQKVRTSVRTGPVVSIGERACFISATAQGWYGSFRFRYATSGPVSQIVITTAQTCAGRWLQAFGCLPHCPQDQQ